MKLLRFIFGLSAIYFKQTALDIMYLYTFAGAVLWLTTVIGQHSVGLSLYAIAPVYVLVIYGLARTTIRTMLVNQYLKQYPESSIITPSAEVYDNSISAELGSIEGIKPVATYGTAKLFLAVCSYYRQAKGARFLAKQVYYTVLEVPLSRRLPHVLFDSKTAKRRQFKSLYLKVQRLHVQGSFDDIFDTYVPQTYHIDSLSFITPDVMEVLMEARMYDIEIINDKLLLYAPLLSREEFETFATKGNLIAKELNNNISTYRDDRLMGADRTTNVTLFARSLLRNPMKYLRVSGLLAVLIIAIIVGAILWPQGREGILLNQFSLVIYLFFIVNVVRAVSTIRTNRQALENYHILYETYRGKPITKRAIL